MAKVLVIVAYSAKLGKIWVRAMLSLKFGRSCRKKIDAVEWAL
jgi:hypothetical protein